MNHALTINGAPFLRVEAVSFERNELLVKLPDGDHGIYAIDGYWRNGEQCPVSWSPAQFEEHSTHCRFTVKGDEFEIPLGSNLGEIIPIGTSA